MMLKSGYILGKIKSSVTFFFFLMSEVMNLHQFGIEKYLGTKGGYLLLNYR